MSYCTALHILALHGPSVSPVLACLDDGCVPDAARLPMVQQHFCCTDTGNQNAYQILWLPSLSRFCIIESQTHWQPTDTESSANWISLWDIFFSGLRCSSKALATGSEYSTPIQLLICEANLNLRSYCDTWRPHDKPRIAAKTKTPTVGQFMAFPAIRIAEVCETRLMSTCGLPEIFACLGLDGILWVASNSSGFITRSKAYQRKVTRTGFIIIGCFSKKIKTKKKIGDNCLWIEMSTVCGQCHQRPILAFTSATFGPDQLTQVTNFPRLLVEFLVQIVPQVLLLKQLIWPFEAKLRQTSIKSKFETNCSFHPVLLITAGVHRRVWVFVVGSRGRRNPVPS